MDQTIPIFVEEIDFDSIELFEVVGKGTFGTVKKGRWQSKDVAVKVIETEQERTAFIVELRQLSRVDHPNIVKLYGACTKPTSVCLVMEYAEGGSLYNVLHRMPNTHYTAAHAVSWALQCASGVAYLHNMKPKALVHRDLKPPNMLLILNGTVLKICDFGTACDLQTVMTNNKGSAAWMAPEVFEGSNYSEKCDVFSWGIILWEVLSRSKPFDSIGGPAFRIMWAVHSGKRPPLIRDCPPALEELMTSCWANLPSNRPSMAEVEAKLRVISRFFKGAKEPITVLTPEKDQPESEEHVDLANRVQGAAIETGSSTCVLTSIRQPNIPLQPSVQQVGSNHWISQSGSKLRQPEQRSVRVKDPGKRLSADFSTTHEKPIHGHRRSGSWGTPLQLTPQQSTNRTLAPLLLAGSRETLVPTSTHLSPRPSPSSSRIEPGQTSWPSPNPSASSEETPTFDNLNAYLLLEPKFQPLPPAPNCPESITMFQSHCQKAQEFLRVQAEMEVIRKRREDLYKCSDREQPLNTSLEDLREFCDLQNEKDGLVELRKNLKKQLRQLKSQRVAPPNKSSSSDEWVMI